MDILPYRVPWYVVGPLMGALVVALYALANQRLGVTTAYAQAVTYFRDHKVQVWRVWYFVGLMAGALLVSMLRGGPAPNLGYGVLSAVLPVALLVPLLFGAGVLIGFGARWAGGCTSGHGLAGTASLSKASFVATITFMATAIGVTLIIHTLSGGVL